jgi:hypothetical protein
VFSPDTFGMFVAQIPRDIVSDAKQDVEIQKALHIWTS